jgi:hypothetical protein
MHLQTIPGRYKIYLLKLLTRKESGWQAIKVGRKRANCPYG